MELCPSCVRTAQASQQLLFSGEPPSVLTGKKSLENLCQQSPGVRTFLFFTVSIPSAGFHKSRSARGGSQSAFLPLFFFFFFGLLAGGRSIPASFLRFYCERADFSLSLFVLRSTFSFHHTAIIAHMHTLSTAPLFMQSLKL